MKTIILMLVGMIIFIVVMITALNIREKEECNTWQSQSRQYTNYFITQWQADQCKAHGIIIDSPII